MQTFLPHPNFPDSAAVLDNKRLGKQRVEVIQILNALTLPHYGWKNHPAVRMWLGYEFSLANYGLYICDEWIRRGFKDTCRGKIAQILDKEPLSGLYTLRGDSRFSVPPWMGQHAVHASHRSNLLRKDPEHYGQFNWDEPPDLPYFWPVNTNYEHHFHEHQRYHRLVEAAER